VLKLILNGEPQTGKDQAALIPEMQGHQPAEKSAVSL